MGEPASSTPAVPVSYDELLAVVRTMDASIAHLEAVLCRPPAAPGGLGVGHWVPGDTNLHPAALNGVQGQSWVRAVRTIVLSVSAAGLVVIGNNKISAGGVSDGELVRVKLPAAGVYPISFGDNQGFQIGLLGGSGQMVYWTDTAALIIDVMVVHE